jgi:hypothetical protein
MEQKKFQLQILGRTLEHLGVQMYKQRNTAIAELVANCWDAGAKKVNIFIPETSSYNQLSSNIIIKDDGYGMDDQEIADAYLVIGRNRRKEDSGISHGRQVMGRKGIGKLAGFGMAKEMNVKTWKNGSGNSLKLDINQLKADNNEAKNVEIPSMPFTPDSSYTPTGTLITLTNLKHKTAIDIDNLHQSLARRFSRSVKNEMEILINDLPLHEINLEVTHSYPDISDYLESTLSDGKTVSYKYQFSQKPISNKELRGFVIYANGKLAQAPDFFFNMEGKVTGQHGTKYITGEIIADFLDLGIDDESDNISTDRQEIDWENETTQPLKIWGENKIKEIFIQWLETRGGEFSNDIFNDPLLHDRISLLDTPSQKQLDKILNILGKSSPDPEKGKELAGTLIRAFEYRHFHDVIDEIEAAAFEEPEKLNELLDKLSEWKTLESRSIYEIIHGRLSIIEKFHQMIVNNAPETASKLSKDNMHDIVAGYPWLLNPEWQILAEEKSISNQLKEWNIETEGNEHAQRYDFIALSNEGRMVIIEIKRAGHPVGLNELQRAEQYQENLRRAHPDIYLLFISGVGFNVSESIKTDWKKSDSKELSDWNTLHTRTKVFYDHYKDILEGNITGRNFKSKEIEVIKTRKILEVGTVHRNPEERRKGLGSQDVDFSEKK